MLGGSAGTQRCGCVHERVSGALDTHKSTGLQNACLQVSCLALSRSGRFLASGQVTYMGFTADIIIWDLETKQLMHRMALHKVRGRACAVSAHTCPRWARALALSGLGTEPA